MAVEKKIVWFVLGVIFVFGGYLRFMHSGDQSLWMDEAFTINAATAVLNSGFPILDSGHFYYNNFLPVYITALLINAGSYDPFNPWVLRLPGVLFGSFLILITFFFSKRLFKDDVLSLFSSFFVAFSYNAIAWSRQVRGYEAAAFLICLAAYFLWRYIESGKRKELALSSAALFFSCISHWVTLAYLPVFILGFFRKKMSAVSEKTKAIGFLACFLVIPPALVYASIFSKTLKMVSRYLFFPSVPFIAIAISGFVLVVAHWRPNIVSPFLKKLLIFSIIVLFGKDLLLFYPISRFDLKLATLLPDYSAGFSVIKQIRKPGELVLSPFPVLQRVYLGEDGIWLPVMGDPSENDRYTNVPLLTFDGFKKLTNENHGYVLIGKAYSRENKNVLFLKEDSRFRLIYHDSGDRPSDALSIYKF